MGIVTLEQYKTILGITDASKDAQIAELIPEIEADYLIIRNIPFSALYGNITTGSNEITNISKYDDSEYSLQDLKDVSIAHLKSNVETGQTISGYGIQGTVQDVDVTNNKLIVSTQAIATKENIECTLYPKGSKLTACYMLQWKMNRKGKGEASENIKGYGYSLENLVVGYPKSIVGSIRNYTRCR